MLKTKHRQFKTLLSIGGWTYSASFPAPASTDTGRKTFASSAVRLLADHGFDGIDIDWEYPANADQAGHYVELLREVRTALDAHAGEVAAQGYARPNLLLTVACPAGPQHYQKLQIQAMDPYLDFWNLMAYDYAGSWDQVAGHQANMYKSSANAKSTPFDTDSAVSHYISRGVQAKKLVIGMPLYGRAFENTKGPGKSFSGVGQGSWENGVWDFKVSTCSINVCACDWPNPILQVLPRPGATEQYDAEAKATYCFDGNTMVSYDNANMAREKATYIQSRKLGGAMWWESSGDRSGDQSLVSTVSCKANPLVI